MGFFKVLERVFFAALAIFVLILSVVDLPDAIRAAQDEGKHGTFTTQREECSFRSRCRYFGGFVSDDGSVRQRDAYIDTGVEEVGVCGWPIHRRLAGREGLSAEFT